MLKKIYAEPVEGFTVELYDENNLFEWKIWIEGPKDTPYEGGVFQLVMTFPSDYPMAPPELKFISSFWHPNVYKDTGIVCISILHPPVEDEMSGELPEERWLPTQTVTTILLSVISILNAPNFSSPANVDASVEWRNYPNSYKSHCKQLVDKSLQEKPSHVVIPHPDTNPEERAKQVEKMKELEKPLDMDDFMHDDNIDPDELDEDASDMGEDAEDSQSSKEEKKPKGKKTKKEKKKNGKSIKNTSPKKTKKSSKEEVEEREEGTADDKRKKKKKSAILCKANCR